MVATCCFSATALAPASAALRLPRRRAGCATQQQRAPRRLAVRATAQPEPEQRPAAGGVLADLTTRAEQVLGRYDFVSAGMGALLITGFCVARGQDVGTALWITAASTVGECGRQGLLQRAGGVAAGAGATAAVVCRG